MKSQAALLCQILKVILIDLPIINNRSNRPIIPGTRYAYWGTDPVEVVEELVSTNPLFVNSRSVSLLVKYEARVRILNRCCLICFGFAASGDNMISFERKLQISFD